MHSSSSKRMEMVGSEVMGTTKMMSSDLAAYYLEASNMKR